MADILPTQEIMDIVRFRLPLPQMAACLSRQDRIKIVAIGSSSTEGAGASGPEASYPAVLARELSQRFPNASIAVFNKGVGGERIDATIARFEKDVVALNPDLVIWQVGTNDATAAVGWIDCYADVHESVSSMQ